MGTMPHDVKEMLGLVNKSTERSKSGKAKHNRKGSTSRSTKFGELTPRRLEKFEQYYKRRSKIKLANKQKVQARSPIQQWLHGGQRRRTGIIGKTF